VRCGGATSGSCAAGGAGSSRHDRGRCPTACGLIATFSAGLDHVAVEDEWLAAGAPSQSATHGGAVGWDPAPDRGPHDAHFWRRTEAEREGERLVTKAENGKAAAPNQLMGTQGFRQRLGISGMGTHRPRGGEDGTAH